jgi:hypothetical protein
MLLEPVDRFAGEKTAMKSHIEKLLGKISKNGRGAGAQEERLR